MYKADRELFDQTAKFWTETYAMEQAGGQEAVIGRLCDMGFDREAAVGALQAAGGDESAAVNAPASSPRQAPLLRPQPAPLLCRLLCAPSRATSWWILCAPSAP